jgi:hypothetical protein
MMSWLVARCITRQIEAPLETRSKPSKRERFFWASETEQGTWRVQFEADKYGVSPVFNNIKADTCWEAAETVRPLTWSAE